MKPRRGRSALAATFFLIFAIVLVAGGYGYWYTHRPVPDDARQVLFEGITYIRDVRREPCPLVIHVILVDLDTPGISFMVTPGEAVKDGELRARTTSQFLDEFDLQLAVNGSFFSPWWSHAPWDYYPHVGDPVNVKGLASSRGNIYSQVEPGYSELYISNDNRAQFNAPAGDMYNALAGNVVLVERGDISTQLSSNSDNTTPNPRTAIALDKTSRTLIIVVVDGRQPSYSEGATLLELARLCVEYGGDTALNLDGGGSTALIVEGKSGKPVQLNSPIDNRIPGRERPVANHLGIYAHHP